MVKRKSNVIVSLLVMMMFALTPVLLSGCNKKLKSIDLSIQNGITQVMADTNYNLILKTNNKKTDGITFVFNAGGDIASISGTTLTISKSATPGTTIKIIAQSGEIKSNELKLDVTHIEATRVDFVNEEETKIANEFFTPNVKAFPENCTRPLVLSVASAKPNIAEIRNNKVYISSTAEIDDTFEVTAKFGNDSQVISSKTYKIIDTGIVYGLEFINPNILKNVLTVDASINATENISVGASTKLNNKDIIRTLSTIEYAFTNADNSVANILNFNQSEKTITALEKGEVSLLCSQEFNGEQHSVELNINVKITPEQIQFNENYSKNQKVGTYYSAKQVPLKNLIPTFVSPRGNSDYSLIVKNSSNQTAQFDITGETINNVTAISGIDYLNNNLTISNADEYTVYFQSLSGCKVEKQSRKIKLTINEGVNVSTPQEYLAELSGSKNKIVNVTSDIVFAAGNELQDTIHSQGDKQLNGNGYTIDLSKKDWGVKVQGGTDGSNAMYDHRYFMIFDREDHFTPFNIVLRDFNLVGNFGNKTLSELSAKTGIPEASLTDSKICTSDLFNNMSYYGAIRIHDRFYDAIDTSKTYSTVDMSLSNLEISNFNKVLKAYYVVDKSLKNENLKAAVNDVKMRNIFGDGLSFEGSQVRVENSTVDGSVGGSPLIGNGHELAMAAGIHRNEQSVIQIGEGNDCRNDTNGNSIYLKGQIAVDPVADQIVSALGGMSGIINTLAAAKVTYLSSFYQSGSASDNAKLDNIEAYSNNILKPDPHDARKQIFNLICFENVKGYNIEFSPGMQNKYAKFTNAEILKGINTTAQFIYINAYDAISDIKAVVDKLGAGIEFLKDYIIVLNNYNYINN